jgi:hypothetical protein
MNYSHRSIRRSFIDSASVSVLPGQRNFRRRGASDNGREPATAGLADGHTGGVPPAFARQLVQLTARVRRWTLQAHHLKHTQRIELLGRARRRFRLVDRRYAALLDAGLGEELSAAMDELLGAMESLESVATSSFPRITPTTAVPEARSRASQSARCRAG